MDFVDKDFIDSVHQGVSFFGTELFGERYKSRQIAEQDRDLPFLPLDPIPLCQDFLGQPP
jgi:hypothetical protein